MRPHLLFVLLMLGCLGGCGFQPLYQQSGRAGFDPLLASVKVAQIGDRMGQLMTNQLRDAFNPTSNQTVSPVFTLEVALILRETDVAIRTDSLASRTDTFLGATWILRRNSDGKTVYRGRSLVETGHDVTNSEYANVVAGNNDLARSVREVGIDIQTKVTLFLHSDQPAL